MRNLKTIYLTILHCMVLASLAGNVLYFSDKYEIVKIDTLQAHDTAQAAAADKAQEDYAMIIAQSGKETKSAFAALDKKRSK